MTYHNLNPDKALIWRIIHRDNLPWILNNGVHCKNSVIQDPNYVNIGNPELIDRRSHRAVPISPQGSLSDYVPFYFTPFSPMMLNIKTGYGGIRKRDNEEIIILVSSLHRAREVGLRFLFTDRHAYVPLAKYFSEIGDLSEIDWPILQARNFKRDVDDPERVERYQAEALIYQHLPTEALLGLICYNEAQKAKIDSQVKGAGLSLAAHAMPGWYF